MNIALVTGCSGLIGSQSVKFLIDKGFLVIGIDNHMRGYFFGKESSTENVTNKLLNDYKLFNFYNVDIRNYDKLEEIFKINKNNIKLIIHTAAQPSHDWASKEPITDFTINANGTLNLLELTRIYSFDATFIYTSTNKVYGDRPNKLNFTELVSRFEYYDNDNLSMGINEEMSIDNSIHSLFGVSKTSADLLCQEYGKYFKMKIGVFRGGCLTGPNHMSSELHGFLSYLIKCMINNKKYRIIGYKGKQVRDNIHSEDLLNAFWLFYNNPKYGEVYNIGGGRNNSVSILEVINLVNNILGMNWKNYEIINENRVGDHIWYITDFSKFKKEYPEWELKYDINSIIKSIIFNSTYDNKMINLTK
jgi:CDP-paratose 2-epimerase